MDQAESWQSHEQAFHLGLGAPSNIVQADVGGSAVVARAGLRRDGHVRGGALPQPNLANHVASHLAALGWVTTEDRAPLRDPLLQGRAEIFAVLVFPGRQSTADRHQLRVGGLQFRDQRGNVSAGLHRGRQVAIFGVQQTMATRRTLSVLAVVVLVLAAGCNSTDADLPEIATPLGYDTVRVELSGCNTALPPLRDNSRCGASEIGKTINVNDVCLLLRALKEWVESGPSDAPSVHADDWPRVRAVCISRLVWGPAISSNEWPRGILAQESPPVRSALRLEADIPNRSQIIFVQMSEQSRRLEYFAGPRTQPWTFTILGSGG